ncbi:transport permease protein [Tersicoccus solisilvae]|uniref:Transport permease protein n=1 Tax=Tersicoccus solisilvae TaxID=1882339 RepID=A0ABQ1P8A2_9MICC|nr:ABC transporter permease [Tersicoccus solisilvae]GGC93148.1 transport permease protein [Tersicoccus solisilvae]
MSGSTPTALTYSGRAHGPAVSAAKARRWGALYYAEHALRSMRAYAGTIALESIGSPLLYLYALGVGLAVLVDRNGVAANGVSYLQFVAPALVTSAALMTVGLEMMFPVMDGFKWRRVYYGPNASPLTPGQIAAGHLMAVGVRLTVQTVAYVGILHLFGAVPSLGTGWLIVPIAVLGALAFGAPVMAYSATLEGEGFQFSMIQRFVITPLFLFSGTFYPLETMPAGLQWIGWISPLWHTTQLARVVSFGLAVPPWLMVVHLVVLVALAVTGMTLARRFFTRRLGR